MRESPRFRGLAAAAAVLLAAAAAVLLVGGVGLLAAVANGPAAQATAKTAAPPAAWGVVQRIPDLDAVSAKANQGCPSDGDTCGGIELNALSCPKSGYCAAVGDYEGQSGNDGTFGEGWVATETAGVWTAPKLVELGQGGDPSYVDISAVSCASPGNCAAVGRDSEEAEATGYVDTYGALYIDLVNGKWSAPRQIPGTDTLNQGNYANGTSVSCGAPGDCGVTGTVNGSQEFVDTETNGVWGTAELVPGSKYAGGSGPSISCPKPGMCTFAGSDVSATSTSVTSVATETDGVWGDVAQLPGFAAAGGAINSLSCRAVGDCSAGGWAYSGTHTVPFVASESSGTWTSSAVGGFAKLSPASVDTGQVGTISCGSPGNCSAGGTYRPSVPETNVFLFSEVNGVWNTAQPVAGIAKSEQGISVPQISCPAAGDCAALVWRAGHAYVELESGGTWAPPRPVQGSTGSGWTSSVSCSAPGLCVAGGTDHGASEIWVLARSTAATTLTSVSPSAAKLTYGKETAEKISVTVTATTPTPAGRVTVTANGKAACTITLKNGTGSCKLTGKQLKPGTYKMAAAYRGATPYKASTSAAKAIKVAG